MSNHQDLIEKVARAIADNQAKRFGWKQQPSHINYFPEATAALSAVYEALKEPSEEMIDAFDLYNDLNRFRIIRGWQSALSSSPLGKGE